MLRNDSAGPLTAIVEERRWVRDALTADRVTALQAFRDLFSAQVLRPGDDVAVARITLLFTALKRSTDLYGRLGARQRVVSGKSVSVRLELGGHRSIKTKKQTQPT